MAQRAGQSYMLDIDGMRIVVTRKRVKNVNFRFNAQGEPTMSIPWNMSRERAVAYAHSHLDWFRVHAQKMQQRKMGAPQHWATGETLYVWGIPCTLRVCETRDTPLCVLEPGELVVHVPMGSTEQGRRAFVERWLEDELRLALDELLPECEERTGLHPTSLTLRRMKTRWGSCTPKTGRIRLNTALAECPRDCLETVLIHELCHLREANHGARFYALMDLYCPSWRVSQRWLNEHTPRV